MSILKTASPWEHKILPDMCKSTTLLLRTVLHVLSDVHFIADSVDKNYCDYREGEIILQICNYFYKIWLGFIYTYIHVSFDMQLNVAS